MILFLSAANRPKTKELLKLLLLFFFICLISTLKEISVIKFSLTKNQTGDFGFPSHVLYQLSYSNIVTILMENELLLIRISKAMPQTSRQSWF